MHLSDVAIRNAKPTGRPQKLSDGDGLYLQLNPNRSRWWRFRYRVGGREKLISLGTYPEVPLKLAGERRDEARRLVADGGDPSAKRQAERAARADTFEALAREWLEMEAKTLGPRTLRKKTERFEAFVFPYLGTRPIIAIKAADVLAVLKRIEARGKHETAHRVRSECGNVFRYAVATSRAERDPTIDLRGAIAAVSRRNRPAIVNPSRIGELMRAIDGYRGDVSTEFALRLLPLTFVRPGESFLPRRRLLDRCSPNSNPSARSRPCLRNARHANRGEVSPVFANLVLARRAGIFLGRRDLLAHGGQAVGWQLCLLNLRPVCSREGEC